MTACQPQWLDAMARIARAAGQVVLEVYAQPFEVRGKADCSPVTEADERAERVIVPALQALAPGVPVVAEEAAARGDVPQVGREFWLVDPLDGTKEFVRRNGEFTVNIALMERTGEPAGTAGVADPIGGVVYAPVKDLLYFAWRGGGAWRDERASAPRTSLADRVGASRRLPLAVERAAYTVVASRSHMSPETEEFIRAAEREHGRVELASLGSALKICLVAEGSADAYPRFAPTMEWDTAAGHAIALEAGRTLVDPRDGRPLRYNKEDLVNPWFLVR